MKITDPDKQIKKRKTVKGVLREVRRLLSDFDNWVQGDWEAAKEDGSFCYCLNGAIDRVADSPELAKEVKRQVDEAIPRQFLSKHNRNLDFDEICEENPIIELNDGLFHKRPRNAWKAILKTLDRALAN